VISDQLPKSQYDWATIRRCPEACCGSEEPADVITDVCSQEVAWQPHRKITIIMKERLRRHKLQLLKKCQAAEK
jgi:hypothetical protein